MAVAAPTNTMRCYARCRDVEPITPQSVFATTLHHQLDLHHHHHHQQLKRPRPASDVDGPNTLHASRKKRRLRNMPAAAAAVVDVSRTPARPQATSYLRYSLSNSLRKRLESPQGCQALPADQAVTVERMASKIYHDHAPYPGQRRSDGGGERRHHEGEERGGGGEEDHFAFLHLEYEYKLDDDSEHVYCDFDALFGASSGLSAPGDDHTYEEYLNELDGFSWRIQ